MTKSDSSWSPKGSGIAKEAKSKHLPRTWGKKKTSFEIRPYQKMMNKKLAG